MQLKLLKNTGRGGGGGGGGGGGVTDNVYELNGLFN